MNNEFKSILFKKGNHNNLKTTEPPFFKDLNLDKIVNSLIRENNDYIKHVYYTSLKDEDEILYRHEVFKDIKKEEIYNALKKFLINIHNVKKFISNLKDYSYKYQKQRIFLEAVLLYCSSIVELSNKLKQHKLESEALKAFHRFKD